MQRTVALFLALVAATGCHRPKHYETSVEVTRVTPVRKDPAGKTLTLDFEYSFVDCPGTQLEVVRGDEAFATCTSKYKVGDRVRLGIDHVWTDEGQWTWRATTIGDCPRAIDPNDEASFALVRECDDWLVNGQKVGFQCRYLPEKKLIDKCPWFKRH